MSVTLRMLARGLATYVPGSGAFALNRTGGTDSARYCYSVWLRHLVMARAHGLDTSPKRIAELGPGDSVGTAVAALISGCEQVYAFDVVAYANLERNLSIFEALIPLFRERADIPGEDEFPRVKPSLDDYRFPADILTPERLDAALAPERLERIRAALRNPAEPGAMLQYRVPWHDASVVEPESLDLIYSQAVLEHVDDLEGTYDAMRQWLKPTGYVSHQIDFKSHGTAAEWNGHWAYGDLTWKLIRGKRLYFLNRQPFSTHLRLLEASGFRIVGERRVHAESRYRSADLAPAFRAITGDDLVTSGAFVQAVRA